MTIHVKGTTGLLVAAVIVGFPAYCEHRFNIADRQRIAIRTRDCCYIAVLVAFPAYRVFFAISVGIGVVVAALLYVRNKYRPITDKDIENKRPLGL